MTSNAGKKSSRFSITAKCPPEDEKQPSDAERAAVQTWLDQGMRDHLAKASDAKATPLARRVTIFEYQNTMRDLLGIDLELIKDLSQDPQSRPLPLPSV